MQQQITDIYSVEMCPQDLQRYRMTFRVDNFEFIKSRVKYVGHDIMQDRNI